MEDKNSWRTWEYDFPPFYTLQPVQKTRTQQINSWANIILAYCKSKNISTLDNTSKLFKNEKINRNLSNDAINQIFQELVKNGQLKFANNDDKNTVIVLWKSISTWAELIYSWAQNYAISITTLFDIINGDDAEGQEFYKQNDGLISEALLYLQNSGKAEVFYNEVNVIEGVKFFF